MTDRKPKAKTNTSTLQIRLPLELRDKLNALCLERNINASETIRQLIIQWINEQESNSNPHRRKTDLDNI